jgi:hypothetical protein
MYLIRLLRREKRQRQEREETETETETGERRDRDRREKRQRQEREEIEIYEYKFSKNRLFFFRKVLFLAKVEIKNHPTLKNLLSSYSHGKPL